MTVVQSVNTQDRSQVRRFVRVPFRLYADTAQWVPPLFVDAEAQLNRQKHPFYTHSEAEFFIASRGGVDVGRLAVLENRRYNEHHGTRLAQFYLFDCVNDSEAAQLLFERAFEWARARQLDRMVGPKGFSALDGYGMLVKGFEHRQMMTMMNYNPSYMPDLVAGLGFEKELDFVSCYLHAERFRLPERIHRIAARVLARGNLRVVRFQRKRELRAWAERIGEAYNQAFVENWEYYPLSGEEIQFVLDNLMLVADPRLIKIIAHGEKVVGFLFAFPDLSAALQRARGRLFPFGLFDLLLEMRRTKWVALNGAGILPEYQGRGGNALLYSEMEKTITEFGFQHADLTQIAESATQMRNDLETLGGEPYKNHRVYTRAV